VKTYKRATEELTAIGRMAAGGDRGKKDQLISHKEETTVHGKLGRNQTQKPGGKIKAFRWQGANVWEKKKDATC